MASAFDLMKRGVTKMDVHHGIPGVLGVALDTGAGLGASYAIGRVYAGYRDKWYGKHAPTIAAVAGKAVAVGLAVFANSDMADMAKGVFDAVGQAGVNAIGLEMGVRHGMKAADRHVVVLPKGAAAAADQETLMGVLPPARPGRALSFEQIEELAAMH
jgi:hypothetical protein